MRLPVDDLNLSLALGALDDRAAAIGARRERLRFTRFSFERTPNARCVAEVELEYQPGDAVVGRAEGFRPPWGTSGSRLKRRFGPSRISRAGRSGSSCWG